MQQNNISKTPKIPAGLMAQMTVNRLGTIISNLSLVATCLLPLCIFSVFIPIFYYIMLFMMVIFTLGLVFLTIPNFGSWFTFGGSMMEVISKVTGHALPVLIALSLGGAIVSMVLLLLDKNNRQWGRIGISIALCVIVLIVLIGIVVGGLK